MKALREAYGECLRKYGQANEKVVVLDADLATSTKSVMFAQACPDRFFDVGIAEANICLLYTSSWKRSMTERRGAAA